MTAESGPSRYWELGSGPFGAGAGLCARAPSIIAAIVAKHAVTLLIAASLPFQHSDHKEAASGRSSTNSVDHATLKKRMSTFRVTYRGTMVRLDSLSPGAGGYLYHRIRSHSSGTDASG